MNKRALTTLSLLALLAVPLAGHCSTPLTAHVVSFGTYGNGNVWVTLDAATDQSGCSTPYLEFGANGVANKSVLAAAAIALATGSTVSVQVDGCLSTGQFGSGTFTGARNGTAFGVNKP
jgi:hypothetical protein